MANSIIHYFPRTDLRCSHLGLTLVAKKAKFDPGALERGEFLVFVNTARTAMKIFAHGNLLVHYKSPRGYIDLRTLQFIPQAFHGGKFTYDLALAKVLEKDFKKKGIRYGNE